MVAPMRSVAGVFLVGGLLVGVAACHRSAPHPSGEALYRQYCASCHGTNGKGDGTIAGELKKPPTDLTQLARQAGGQFDEAAVIAVIDGQRLVAAHGPRAMPVWGVVFDEELSDQSYSGYTVLLRARVLSDYLRSIQEK